MFFTHSSAGTVWSSTYAAVIKRSFYLSDGPCYIVLGSQFTGVSLLRNLWVTKKRAKFQTSIIYWHTTFPVSYAILTYRIFSICNPWGTIFFSGPTPGALLESGVLPESGTLNFFSGKFEVNGRTDSLQRTLTAQNRN